MPTTNNEAIKIVGIMCKYLPPEDALSLLNELTKEVAYTTINYSVRSSLFMLERLVNPGFFDNLDRNILINLEVQWNDMKLSEEYKEWHSISLIEWLGLTEEEFNKYKV